MRLLSEAKVARRCASWGEAASLSRGGDEDIVEDCALEGEEDVGEAPAILSESTSL